MATIKTYVSSYTYDELLLVSYPDDSVKERSLDEVERLILQGHTVEYRFGDNMSTVLDLEKFNTFIKPRFEEYTPVNVTELKIQNALDNLTPIASDPFKDYVEEKKEEATPEVPVEPVPNVGSVDLTTMKVEEPKVNEKGEEVVNLEKVEKKPSAPTKPKKNTEGGNK